MCLLKFGKTDKVKDTPAIRQRESKQDKGRERQKNNGIKYMFYAKIKKSEK